MTTGIKSLSIISTILSGLLALGALAITVIFLIAIGVSKDELSFMGGYFETMIFVVVAMFGIAFVLYLVLLIMGIVAPVKYSKTRAVNSFKAEAIVKIVIGSITTLIMLLLTILSASSGDSSGVAVALVLLLFMALIPILSIVELVLVGQEKKREMALQYTYSYNQQF